MVVPTARKDNGVPMLRGLGVKSTDDALWEKGEVQVALILSKDHVCG